MTAKYTPAGLTVQTFDDARAEAAARLQARYGAVNTDVSSAFGQLASWLAENDVAQQEALAELMTAHNPLSSYGVAQDNLCALTGTQRRGATAGTVEITFSGTLGWSVFNGTAVVHGETQTVWVTQAVANVVSPTVKAVCQTTGLIAAPAGSSWTLQTPDPTITAIANAYDATPGAAAESAGKLRARRNTELYANSQGPLAAIAGRISRASDHVQSVRVYHNPTIDPVDSYGVPFKAFAPHIWLDVAPTTEIEDQIAAAIWGAMGAGGQSYGSTQLALVDSEGQAQSLGVTFVGIVQCYVKITLSTASAEYATQTAAEALAVLQPLVAKAAEAWSVPGRDVTTLDVLGVVTAAMAAGKITGYTGATVEFATLGGGPYNPGPFIVARDKAPEILAAYVSVAVTA